MGRQKRGLLRSLWLRAVAWDRVARLLWTCPRCLRVRHWGSEHLFDLYPMLLDMWELPACCRQEFPQWAYNGGV